MKSKTFVYTGCENLEAVKEAENYNNYLVDIIIKDGDLKNNSKKILDFGAGSGTYADMLNEKGYKIACLEPDKKLQKILKSKRHSVVGKVSELKPETFDVIYALNVLEHIEDDSSTTSLLKDALKSGGILIIYVPAFPILFSSMDKLVEHVRRYKRFDLQKIANNNNLLIERLEYRDPIGFFAALTYKFIGNKTGVLDPASVKFYDKMIFPVSKLLEPLSKYALGKNALLVARKK